MTASTHLVPFMGDSLTLVEKDAEPFVAVRPICERLGLAWQAQHAKLTTNSVRWGVTIIVTPSAGGAQEMTCIPLFKIFGWLTTISPSKVAPEVRDVLIAYQNKCDAVLAHFWLDRIEDQLAEKDSRLVRLTGELLARKPSWAKLKFWVESGMSDAAIQDQASGTKWRTRQALADMRAAGLIPPEELDLTPMEQLMGVGDA